MRISHPPEIHPPENTEDPITAVRIGAWAPASPSARVAAASSLSPQNMHQVLAEAIRGLQAAQTSLTALSGSLNHALTWAVSSGYSQGTSDTIEDLVHRIAHAQDAGMCRYQSVIRFFAALRPEDRVTVFGIPDLHAFLQLPPQEACLRYECWDQGITPPGHEQPEQRDQQERFQSTRDEQAGEDDESGQGNPAPATPDARPPDPPAIHRPHPPRMLTLSRGSKSPGDSGKSDGISKGAALTENMQNSESPEIPEHRENLQSH